MGYRGEIRRGARKKITESVSALSEHRGKEVYRLGVGDVLCRGNDEAREVLR